MYFSRVRMNTSSVSQRELISLLRGGAYASHKLIWKLFPDDPSGKRTFLFRQEFEKEQIPSHDFRRGLPIFYVVSEKPPSSVDGSMEVETKAYNPQLRVGMRLAFDLRVNPIVARGVDGKKHSAKHDVLMDAKRRARQQRASTINEINTVMNEAAIDWLSDSERTHRHGYRLIDPSRIEVSGYRQHVLRRRNARDITFSSVDLVGSLEVIDPESFRTLLFSGIGRSRSFGCGMMMVRPI